MAPVANRPPTRPANTCKESGIGGDDDDVDDNDDANKKDIDRCSVGSTCISIYTYLHAHRVLIKLVSM